jgi:hypothetical protein
VRNDRKGAPAQNLVGQSAHRSALAVAGPPLASGSPALVPQYDDYALLFQLPYLCATCYPSGSKLLLVSAPAANLQLIFPVRLWSLVELWGAQRHGSRPTPPGLPRVKNSTTTNHNRGNRRF